MDKTIIFANAYRRALVRDDVLTVAKGFGEEHPALRTVICDMVRREVWKYAHATMSTYDFDKWLDEEYDRMYEDLWRWINAGMPIVGDKEAADLYGFSDIKWN